MKWTPKQIKNSLSREGFNVEWDGRFWNVWHNDNHAITHSYPRLKDIVNDWPTKPESP
jgi:hypothetical protein